MIHSVTILSQKWGLWYYVLNIMYKRWGGANSFFVWKKYMVIVRHVPWIMMLYGFVYSMNITFVWENHYKDRQILQIIWNHTWNNSVLKKGMLIILLFCFFFSSQKLLIYIVPLYNHGSSLLSSSIKILIVIIILSS
jgi:hypothetical protein